MEGFWSRIFGWWEMRWKQVGEFFEFFNMCNDVFFSGVWKSLWLILISVACWSIWMARNEVVFNKKNQWKQ